LENPPAAIIYQVRDSDMDIARFEREVISIGNVIKNCYVQDTKENVIYVPKSKNAEVMKNCVKDSSNSVKIVK
jgi:hypothetical protein